jgi:hypothetical protein
MRNDVGKLLKKISEYRTTDCEISWLIISFLTISQHMGKWMDNIEKDLKKFGMREFETYVFRVFLD